MMKHVTIKLLALTLCLLITLTLIPGYSTITPQGLATLQVSPPETTVFVSTNFNVNVTITNVYDLSFFNITLTYDTTKMDAQAIYIYPPFSSPWTVITQQIDHTTGSVHIVCQALPPVQPYSGTTSMFKVTFHCIASGANSLLHLASTQLLDQFMSSIPHTTTDGTVDQNQPQGPPINVTFRLLAIEGYYKPDEGISEDALNSGTSDEPMKSAQYLITNLMGYNNWQNNSQTYNGYKYTTHIHLLSADPNAGTLPYYRGSPTNSNVFNEIQNFLAVTQSPWENNSLTIRILYYIGHSQIYHGQFPPPGQNPPPQSPWPSFGQGSFFLALGNSNSNPSDASNPLNPTSYQELWDYQLNQLLNTGDLAKNKNNCTLIILDSCHSGAAITGSGSILQRGGRVILTACRPGELANGWLDAPVGRSPPIADHWGWFTGQNSANSYFSNTTQTPWTGGIGIIGAIKAAADPNNDGWTSANEIFFNASQINWASNAVAANFTTYTYSYIETNSISIGRVNGNPQTPCAFWGGVYGCFIPLAQYDASKAFPGNGQALWMLANITSTHHWGALHNDSSRTGTTESGGPTLGNVLWSQPGYDINASVVISKWSAIVATKNGVVHSLDLATGREIWSFTAESQIISTPAITNGKIYVATLGGGGGGGSGGILYVINEPTGRVLWEYQAPTGVGFYASPAVADGRVYVATTSETSTQDWVCAFNQTSGQQLWNRTLETSVKSSPAVKDGRVYIATTTKGSIPARLHALTETSGVKVWNASFGLSNVISTPAVAAGLVIIGCMGGGGGGSGAGLYAFEESSGTPRWSYLTTSPVSSSPAVDEKKGIIVGCSEGPGGGGGRVFALTLTGSYIWSSPPESVKISSPAISGNSLVYVGTTNNLLLCLNETYGTIVWSHATNGPVTSSPAIFDDHVLVGTTGSTLYCFGLPFPDITVTSVLPCKTYIVEGDILNVNVTVTNKGDLAQTFDVTLYFAGLYWSGRAVQTLRVTLAGKSSTTLTFGLGLCKGSYVFSAYAWPVKYEANTLDNYGFGSGVLVAPIARFHGWSYTRPILT